jgi:hypothetical protein
MGFDEATMHIITRSGKIPPRPPLPKGAARSAGGFCSGLSYGKGFRKGEPGEGHATAALRG